MVVLDIACFAAANTVGVVVIVVPVAITLIASATAAGATVMPMTYSSGRSHVSHCIRVFAARERCAGIAECSSGYCGATGKYVLPTTHSVASTTT
jgi:hypothetical protein